MPSKLNRYLVNNGTYPKGSMADWQHAARLFTDDDFRLLPKLKFQYHVVFNYNVNALKTLDVRYRYSTELNMLVKSVDLPRFQMSVETGMQYNRRKLIQTKIDYQPVTIKFHDDGAGVTRQLWDNYYSYYYYDSQTGRGGMPRSVDGSGGPYGLTGAAPPFFNSIVIYQFSRRKWYSYTLVMPVINSWMHDNMSYAATEAVEHSLQVGYEAVYYDSGLVSPDNPPGFGVEHYDRSPSPLQPAGAGGAPTNTRDIFDSPTANTPQEPQPSFITNAIRTVDNYQNNTRQNNTRQNNIGIGTVLGGLAIAGLASGAVTQALGALNNIIFPVNDTENQNSTVAKPNDIFGDELPQSLNDRTDVDTYNSDLFGDGTAP